MASRLTSLQLGGFGSAAGLALGIVGTLFFSGNLVSQQTYTTSRLINNTQGIEVVTQTGSTATGGLKSTSPGNYQAITIVSPMSATNAPLNGLNAGTGVTNYAQVDIVNAVLANTITCSIANVSVRGTGGTTVIPRTTIGTGTIVVRSSGAITLGPTESFRCSLGAAPSPGFSATAVLKLTPSQVAN
jgi:hypothetical protein